MYIYILVGVKSLIVLCKQKTCLRSPLLKYIFMKFKKRQNGSFFALNLYILCCIFYMSLGVIV